MNADKVCHVPVNIVGRAGEGLKGLVLACFWSNPFISAAGCTPDMVAVIARYTGMGEPAVQGAITVLDQIGQIIVDLDTNEALVPGWLDLNYLQERSVAEKPADVMLAIERVKSANLRNVLIKDIARLDVQYDASLSASRG